jgi:prolyl oligopeptidase
MQSRKSQKNPIILKIEADAGHYGANTLGKIIKEDVDVYGFIVNELMGK